MSHCFKIFFYLHAIYSTIKYGLADTGAYGTYISSDHPHENTHKQGHTKKFVIVRKHATIKHGMYTIIIPVTR